jgi:hypothetical protein
MQGESGARGRRHTSVHDNVGGVLENLNRRGISSSELARSFNARTRERWPSTSLTSTT